MLDELIEPVQVDIGEELRRQVSDGDAAAGRGVLQPLVRRHQRPVGRRGDVAHPDLQRRVPEQGMRGLARDPRQPATLHPRFEHPVQRGPVYAVEEIGDVELQVVAAALAAMDLPDERLQPPHRGVRSLAAPVGERIGDECPLVDGFQLRN